jgi:hypothetical protein
MIVVPGMSCCLPEYKSNGVTASQHHKHETF